MPKAFHFVEDGVAKRREGVENGRGRRLDVPTKATIKTKGPFKKRSFIHYIIHHNTNA